MRKGIPDATVRAILAVRRAEDWRRQADHEFFHVMTEADRVDFDKWLVRINHPLAWQAGTTEFRFREVMSGFVPAGKQHA